MNKDLMRKTPWIFTILSLSLSLSLYLKNTHTKKKGLSEAEADDSKLVFQDLNIQTLTRNGGDSRKCYLDTFVFLPCLFLIGGEVQTEAWRWDVLDG